MFTKVGLDALLTLSAGWGFFWRESEQDGLYGIGGNLIVPSNGVPGHYEGSRPIADAGWVVNPHLSLHLSYIFVFNGQFEEQSIHATTTESYVSPGSRIAFEVRRIGNT